MTAYTRGHQLSSLADIARVTMTLLPAHGDLDSAKQASGAVEPGELVEPVAAAGTGTTAVVGSPQGRVAKVSGGVSSAMTGLKRYGIAMRPVETSSEFDWDINNGPIEQVNTAMADGDFVRVAKSGVFLTTLVEQTSSATIATTFQPGTLLTWDGAATRPTGITGTGAWTPAGSDDRIAEVVSFKPVGDGGMLELRLLG